MPAARLERTAGLARAIVELTRDLDRDQDELGILLVVIGELATTIHDTLDAEVRRRGDVGLGFMDPLRAELDDRLQALRPKAAA